MPNKDKTSDESSRTPEDKRKDGSGGEDTQGKDDKSGSDGSDGSGSSDSNPEGGGDDKGSGEDSKGGDSKSGGDDGKDSGGKKDAEESGGQQRGAQAGDAAKPGAKPSSNSATAADEELKGDKKGGKDKGGMPGKGGKKENPIMKLKKIAMRIMKAISMALKALKMMIMMKLIMLLQMLLQAIMAMVAAVVSAAMSLISTVATALGVAVVTAAAVVVGGIFGLIALVVVVVVVVVVENASTRDDITPECNTDTTYMETVEGIHPSAWRNAKLIYTFFKNIGEQTGAPYSDAQIAGALGAWSCESGLDSTAVETVFDEDFGIGPTKRWLWYGTITSTYETEEYYCVTPCESGECTECVAGDENCAKVCERYKQTVLSTGGVNGLPATVNITSDKYGPVYGTGTGTVHGPFNFSTRYIQDVYQTAYWDEYPAIKRVGLGLAQWTDTGTDPETGDPIGRGKDLLDYAEEHNTDWYQLDCQLMFAVSKDGRADWLKNWFDEPTAYTGGFVSTTGRTWNSDYSGTYVANDRVVKANEVAQVAWAAEAFALGYEGVPSGSAEHLDVRIEKAIYWYSIITEWNDNHDYTIGTGSNMLSLAMGTTATAGDMAASSSLRACSELKFFGNATLAEAAVSYSWGPGQAYSNDGTQCWRHLYTTINPNDPYLRSCDRTVALAVHWTGTDPSFPWGNVATIWDYLTEKNTEYQTLLTEGGSLSTDKAYWEKIDTVWTGDVAEYIKQLRPGDILIRSDTKSVPAGYANANVGHVIMYVGEDMITNRWPELATAENGGHHGYCIVSGSINEYSPHIGGFSHSANGSGAYQSYTVFRNRGVPNTGTSEVVNLTCVGYTNDA